MKTWLRRLILFAALAGGHTPAFAQSTTLSGTTCPGAGCDITRLTGAGVSVQITGTFSGTLAFKQSNDQETWVDLTLYAASSTTGVTSTTTTGFYSGGTTARYVRVGFSAYTSGSATVYVAQTVARFAPPSATADDGTLTGTVNVGDGSAMPDPVAGPSAAENGAGSLTGTFGYCYYESTSSGNTACVVGSPVTVSAKKIRVTVPLPQRGTSQRYLCRTTNGGSTYKLLRTFGGGNYYFATGYDDQTADGSLGDACPTSNNTLVYGLSMDETVKTLRSNADVGTVAADLTVLTADPSTSGTFAVDAFGPVVGRTVGAASSFYSQRGEVGGTGYHFLAQTTPTVDAGASPTTVFQINGNGNTQVTAGTLSNQNAGDGLTFSLNTSATFNATNGAAGASSQINATGAGTSAFDQIGQRVSFLPGYTGSAQTLAVSGVNTTASSGNAIGVSGRSTGASALNIGSIGFTTGGTKNLGHFATSAGVEATTTTVPFTGGVSGIALAVGNGTNTDDLIVCVDGTTTPLETCRFKDGGDAAFASATGDSTLQWDWTATSGGGNYRLSLSGGTSVTTGTTNNVPLIVQANGTTVQTLAGDKSTTFNGVTFSALPGTPTNGMFIYCSDCTIANPCASGGTGAFAKRLNGVWVCN